MTKQATQETSLPAVVAVGSYAVMKGGADIAEAIAANMGAGAISPFDLDRVRVPAGGATTWEVPSLEGVSESKALDGIIVHWRTPRSYWSESYDDTGGGTPPDCSSDDGVIGQGDPGGECLLCPLSKFGTARKGGGQACRQMRLLFILREGDHLPIVLAVPPSSLKRINNYFLRLSSQALKYHDVVTRIELRKTANRAGISYAEISPTMVARLGQEEIECVSKYARGLAPIFASVKVEAADVADDA